MTYPKEDAWWEIFNILKQGNFESDKTFGDRVYKILTRTCIGEDYDEYPTPGCMDCYMIRQWTYYYSDGTKETVAVRERAR